MNETRFTRWNVVLPFAVQAVRLAWNGRTTRGRADGLPRGSLRPGLRNDVDPDHLARCVRRDGPIFKTWLLGSPTVCIADLEFGRDLYKVHADDLKHAWLTVERFVPGGTIREIDGPRQEELRRLRTKSLTATRSTRLAPLGCRDDADYPEVAALVADLDPDLHLYGTGISDDEIETKLDRLTELVRFGVERGAGARGAPSLAARTGVPTGAA